MSVKCPPFLVRAQSEFSSTPVYRVRSEDSDSVRRARPEAEVGYSVGPVRGPLALVASLFYGLPDRIDEFRSSLKAVHPLKHRTHLFDR